jgi:hypothetical protein
MFTFPSSFTPPTDPRNPVVWGRVSGPINDQLDLKAAFDQVQDSLDELAVTTINDQTDDYTLVLADANKAVVVNSGADKAITVPLNEDVAFPLGTKIIISRVGAGAVDILGDDGVTINTLVGQRIEDVFGVATLLKRAEDTWLLYGDLIVIPA